MAIEVIAIEFADFKEFVTFAVAFAAAVSSVAGGVTWFIHRHYKGDEIIPDNPKAVGRFLGDQDLRRAGQRNGSKKKVS